LPTTWSREGRAAAGWWRQRSHSGARSFSFALVYWELDRGGPLARAHPELTEPFDFLFTQSTDEGRRLEPAWQPSFVDYLYLSLTNSTAYSPTDTMPLSKRAKLTMGVQSVASLITIGLLIARAIASLRA
jgi:hypothetical protein